jgi:hypothetical protein
MSLANYQVTEAAQGNPGIFRNQINSIFAEIFGRIVTPAVSGTVATTNATVTTAATIATTTGATVNLDLLITGRRTGGTGGTAGDGAAYHLAVGAKNIAGTVTIIAQSLLFTAESQVGWDCTATASGANILVRVTGAANNNVNWSVAGTKREVV